MKSGNNFFVDKENLRSVDTLRIIYFIAFLVSFGATEMGRYLYRPYVYENNINDLGIADSMGNLGGIIVQVFFGLAIFNSTRTKGIRLIIFLVLGYIVYEILQLLLPKGVFDWKDIFGTVIGGVIVTLFFLLFHKVVNRNRVFYRI